ncbi:hypothetical protein CTEN210_18005 [Chaetoceros tenuissimus]|uniref:Alkyl transferase n=1 Tax=Chaetoceros tenuissimus TaxID=426638 RepID=A0AAD3DF66_9STRA|nr:hypothetical protein CTEN210_18005 [Chaetoceros tenuissimus]
MQIGCLLTAEAFQSSSRIRRKVIIERRRKNGSRLLLPNVSSSKKSLYVHQPIQELTSITDEKAIEQDHRIQEEPTNENSEKSIVSYPKHVAFICDGNSRWAKLHQNDSSTYKGHAQGANTVLNLVKVISEQYTSIQYITIYGFSSENWSRSRNEIKDIWNVVQSTVSQVLNEKLYERVKIHVIGDLDDERIPWSLATSLKNLQNKSRIGDENKKVALCLAINYGGRSDILQASKKLARLIASKDVDGNDDTCVEETFESLLSTNGIPDPDLVVRTGGEQRISNFLIWNIAYAELYFTDTLWPDFDEAELNNALQWYSHRERRFGGRREEHVLRKDSSIKSKQQIWNCQRKPFLSS